MDEHDTLRRIRSFGCLGFFGCSCFVDFVDFVDFFLGGMVEMVDGANRNGPQFFFCWSPANFLPQFRPITVLCTGSNPGPPWISASPGFLPAHRTVIGLKCGKKFAGLQQNKNWSWISAVSDKIWCRTRSHILVFFTQPGIPFSSFPIGLKPQNVRHADENVNLTVFCFRNDVDLQGACTRPRVDGGGS